jgi:hypothetical protein
VDRWEFTPKTKAIAWERELRAGRIPLEANPQDFDFHHVDIRAVDHSQPRNLVTSPANCLPVPREIHQTKHKDIPKRGIPLQPPLFDI